MAKKPSKAVKEIAEALMPGTLEKKELFEQVGRAIVHLSDIENILGMIFNVLTPGRAMAGAMDLFFGQGGFEKKLALVDYVILSQGHWREIARWKEISERLRTHRGVRNLIAHQGMFVGQPDEKGRVDVSLRPPWLKSNTKGKHLKLKEVAATASALNEVRLELWDFSISLHSPS